MGGGEGGGVREDKRAGEEGKVGVGSSGEDTRGRRFGEGGKGGGRKKAVNTYNAHSHRHTLAPSHAPEPNDFSLFHRLSFSLLLFFSFQPFSLLVPIILFFHPHPVTTTTTITIIIPPIRRDCALRPRQHGRLPRSRLP